MTYRIFFLLAAFACLGLFARAAQAQTSAPEREEDIRALLEERDQEIKSVLGTQDTFTDAQREELKTLINGLIDFRAMGTLALGPHWKDLTPAQRDEFVDVFSEIVRSQSLANLEPYRSEVSYEDITVEGDEAHVTTTTVYDGEPIVVAYDLAYEDGTWKAYDIIIDEVSTVGGYQRSFQQVIRQQGFDALMESLYNKLDSIQAQR